MSKPDVRSVSLAWSGKGMNFAGGPEGAAPIAIDGDRVNGPSPMDTLLLALAGCMAIDVRHILGKSKVPLDSLAVEARGRHAQGIPRRFVAVELVYRLSGPLAEHQPRLDRAIELSRDKYCSVLHSLDPAIELTVRVERLRSSPVA